jgi:3-dehydroquinate synthase
MGTGKTTAGRMAAEQLGLPFLDLDEIAERRLGTPIADVFDRNGERGFRDIERTLLREAATLSSLVVATGGGAAMHEDEFELFTVEDEVAVLTATEEEIEARVPDAASRPMLRPDPSARIRELLHERSARYAAAGSQLLTSGRRVEDVADELATRYRQRVDPAAPVTIEVGGEATSHGPVVVGEGALDRLGEEVARRLPDARTAAIAFDPGPSDALAAASASLTEAGLRVVDIALPKGEAAKAHDVLGHVWAGLRSAGVEPTDVLVAVGGGAALDLAGFAAATYMRGIPVVHIPTTLLAMVDAAIGGKTAIDHSGAKNLAGAFHAPALVVCDPTTLATLAEEEIRAGLGEVVKAAVLAAPLMLDLLEMVTKPTGWMIEQSVRVKAGYVAADPFDRGLRRSLNLGHTFAHAIESASGFTIRHGEAVSIGLVAAARLGSRYDITDPQLEARLRAVLDRQGLPIVLPHELDRDVLLDAMGADKKRRSGRAAFVVPAEGGAALLEGIEPGEAVECLAATGSSS